MNKCYEYRYLCECPFFPLKRIQCIKRIKIKVPRILKFMDVLRILQSMYLDLNDKCILMIHVLCI